MLTNSSPPTEEPLSSKGSTPLLTAQALAEQVAISSMDWHRLKGNRKARALEQAAVAIVFLIKDQPQEAIAHLQQAVGWLDRSISAPPCPTHGKPGKGQ